jgi:hypothetical protein
LKGKEQLEILGERKGGEKPDGGGESDQLEIRRMLEVGVSLQSRGEEQAPWNL